MPITAFVLSSLMSFGLAFAADEPPEITCDEILKMQTEADFLAQVPNVATEHFDATLENFEPSDGAAARARVLSRDLAELRARVSAGLLLSGPPGVGKSHLLIGAARRASELKMRVLYLTPKSLRTYRRTRLKPISTKGVRDAETRARIESNNRVQGWSAAKPLAHVLGGFDLIVIDDLNDEGVFDEFAAIVTFAHRAEGLKIMAATNYSVDALLANVHKADPLARDRFKDRFRAVFKTQNLAGDSHRPTAHWSKN